jgi:GNAT superfamily N-acetyltransferase
MISPPTLHPLTHVPLAAINAIITACVMSWPIAERVKRLTLASYQYHSEDLRHLSGLVALNSDNEAIGVVTWEPLAASERQNSQLLHALYVDPRFQRQGVGRQLMQAARHLVCQQGSSGLLVKAQAEAIPFFRALGLSELAIVDASRDYPHRFWHDCTTAV